MTELYTTNDFEAWWSTHPIAQQHAKGEIIWALMIGFKEVAWQGWQASKLRSIEVVQELSNEFTERNERRTQG